MPNLELAKKYKFNEKSFNDKGENLMVITRRTTETVNSAHDNSSKNGGVALLEKPVMQAEPVKVENKAQVNTADAERMQKNLYKLLNYDRFSEEVQDVQEEKPVVSALSDEDIRPTSTTMQFGDDSIDQIREEMRQRKVEEETSYHLNAKGKIAVVLYSLVVAVILALIVLNTGVLATMSNESNNITQELNAQIEQYNAIQAEIDNISNPDYVIDIAQNKYGMVKGN